MNLITQHLDKKNLHHAYLIEGQREEILPELIKFTKEEEVIQINLDSFKIDDARNLKSFASEKGYTDKKRIFIISANNFLLEAQNSLLKLFEEPIENTHFFLIIPDTNSLLKTLVSRFYLIKNENIHIKSKEVEEFIKMSLQKRIDFIKELLPKKDEEDEEEDLAKDSNRSKALKFLNALEALLVLKTAFDNNMSRTVLDMFDHFFKVREFLRMPGSSPKSLMESVALIIPNF